MIKGPVDWDDVIYSHRGNMFANYFDTDECTCRELVKGFVAGRYTLGEYIRKGEENMKKAVAAAEEACRCK